jgi:pyruvate dehydrogenase E2 component (dihydrolipoamide acetyltransferase)
MAFEFKLPDLGEGITEAEIRKWLVKTGDTVEEHQAVVELETDKAVVEVPSPQGGTVLKIAKEEGDTVNVGDVLIVLGEAGEKTAEPAPSAKKAASPISEERPKSVSVVGELPEEEEEAKPRAREPQKPAPAAAPPAEHGTEILATPGVRTLAKEEGVALEKLKGTGPAGSITREDVLKAKKQAPRTEEPAGEEERVPLRGLRKTIAKNLVLAQRTAVSVTETEEADITELWDLREREKQRLAESGIRLTFMPFFIKAAQHALKEFGTFNASMDEERGEIVVKKYYHIGVAVDTPEGLIVPVIRNVEKKSVRDLAQELQELSEQARDRKIKLEDLKGSTFTITNYGAFGADFATPVINYPDAAILGTGRIADKPWVREGKIVIRKVLPLSLTFDHLINDGAGAAKFLTRVVGFLEDPASLFIESV